MNFQPKSLKNKQLLQIEYDLANITYVRCIWNFSNGRFIQRGPEEVYTLSNKIRNPN